MCCIQPIDGYKRAFEGLKNSSVRTLVLCTHAHNTIQQTIARDKRFQQMLFARGSVPASAIVDVDRFEGNHRVKVNVKSCKNYPGSYHEMAYWI